jgi:hypothetical protein
MSSAKPTTAIVIAFAFREDDGRVHTTWLAVLLRPKGVCGVS